ncbi:VWA domain-containing protein [Clostridium sp. AL.422]|uniref:VWA domain-containing protein n=1 Tax=Clostridium TaxID=1485 RepID=UPI00293DCD4D|nr:MULTISPECIES: VWA domain-containing protein [unclassified Clostridium]MDV4149370.1 VWA domain-containing protein [Clostridium sp. AL.422]
MIKKKKFKIISIITILFVISTLISLKSLNVKATGEIPDKPDFDFEISASPNPAMVGEDITVSGRIIPKPFEATTPAKEIVLVLDVSGSMNEEIEDPCTNERVRYCTSHDSSDLNHGEWWQIWHRWVNDYCVEHRKSGEHNITTNNRKIDELKRAANGFIEKMRDVPNLKIGIVAYSSIATINPNSKNGTKRVKSLDSNSSHDVTNYSSLGVNFLQSNDSRLTGIINNLDALGGTNTGEGMRKAIHMLDNGEKSASKTIVLMTDGLPTFYSVTGSNKKNYMTIDNTQPQIAGEGTDLDTKSKEYAKVIGEIIKTKGYNSFSVGYGLETDGNDTLLTIHEAMTGLNIKGKPDLYESSGFFPTSTNAIQAVFNKIATQIIDSYPINNIDMNINFTDGFTLNIGGNTVKLNNVNYKKVSERNGKVRYEADPVPFKFIVKGNKPGEQQIYNKISINFPWKDSTITINPKNTVPITIKSNELPSISAKLISESNVSVNKGEIFNVRYQVEAADFVFNDSTNAIPNDIVIVLDVSEGMKDSLTIIKNALFNKLLNIDALKISKSQYGLITYSNQVKQEVPLTDNVTDLNDNYIKKLATDNMTSNISKTFDSITKVLNSGRADAKKNIIFISTGQVSYTESDLGKLKDKGYNIVSLSMNNKTTADSLYKMHSLLVGNTEGYFNVVNNDYNSIENSLMSLVSDRIVSATKYKPYKFNPVLKINLGNNFIPISGIENVSNGIATIKLPEVIYNYVSNGRYSASSITPIEFSISPSLDKSGELNFGEANKNVIVYNKLKGGIVESLITTPVVTVKDEVKNLSHGLYNGINGEVDIQETNNGARFEIAQGSTVTFGAQFTLGGNSAKFELNIDEKFNPVNSIDIKIYKVLKDSSGNNELIAISNENKKIESKGNNNFNISIDKIKEGNQTGEIDILVIYQGRVKQEFYDDDPVINEIIFSETINKAVEIEVPIETDGSSSLPDLF